MDPTERASSSYGSAGGGGGGGGEAAAVAILASSRAFWEASRASEPRSDWTAWWSSRRESFWLSSRTQLRVRDTESQERENTFVVFFFYLIPLTHSLFLSALFWLVWILVSRSSANASFVRRFCWVSASSSVADNDLGKQTNKQTNKHRRCMKLLQSQKYRKSNWKHKNKLQTKNLDKKTVEVPDLKIRDCFKISCQVWKTFWLKKSVKFCPVTKILKKLK